MYSKNLYMDVYIRVDRTMEICERNRCIDKFPINISPHYISFTMMDVDKNLPLNLDLELMSFIRAARSNNTTTTLPCAFHLCKGSPSA